MKCLLVSAAILASGLALTAGAQTPAAPGMTKAPAAAAPAGPTKIAVVAFQVAVSKTNEFQRNFADLQKKYEPKREQLKTLSDEVDSLTKQLQAQGEKLSDSERAARTKKIDDEKKQLDRSAEDAQNDFQQEMQQLYSTMASKVYDVLSGYAQQNGYTIVLDVASQQTPVLYAVPTTDITNPIIQAYNVKSGVPAPPAQPGASPHATTPKTTTPHPTTHTPAAH